MDKAFLNWSSGKDAALALFKTRQTGPYQVDRLFTTLSKPYSRVTMHGLPRSLLEAQTRAIGLPLTVLELEEQTGMEAYAQQMTLQLRQFKSEGYTYSLFGDIFLEDLRQYREEMSSKVGLNCHFPLWGQNTRALVEEFMALGFKAIVISVSEQFLPSSFCGRMLDHSFLEDLPEKVDPCGENGEFHTFCFDGPVFREPVSFTDRGMIRRSYPAPDGKGEYGVWWRDLALE